MQPFRYPCTVDEVAPGEFEVRCPDVPAVLSFAASGAAALENAWDALAAAMEYYPHEDLPVPPPRAAGPGAQASMTSRSIPRRRRAWPCARP